MIKAGQIIDAVTSKGIPYASVEITDSFGTYLGAGASAGVDGVFNLDSTMMQPGTFMRVSSVGYNTQSYPYNEYVQLSTFKLSAQSGSLPEIIITAGKKAAEDKTLLIGVGAALALWYFFVRKKS